MDKRELNFEIQNMQCAQILQPALLPRSWNPAHSQSFPCHHLDVQAIRQFLNFVSIFFKKTSRSDCLKHCSGTKSLVTTHSRSSRREDTSRDRRKTNRWVFCFFITITLKVFYTDEFRDFASRNVQRWREIIEDWVCMTQEVNWCSYLCQVLLASNLMVVHSSDVSTSHQGAIRSILKFLGVKPDPWRLQCLAHANLDYFKVDILSLNPFVQETFVQRKSGRLQRSPYDEALVSEFNEEIKRVSNEHVLIYFEM